MPFVQRGLLVLEPSQTGRLSFDADAANVFSGGFASTALSWLSFDSDRNGTAHTDRSDYTVSMGCGCPACSGASFNDPQFFVDPTSGFAENGLPRYNWDQAAVQLTRDNVGNNNAGWSFNLGTAVTVTYGFRSTAPGTMPDDTGGFSRFSAAQIAAAEAALQAWADVANITFVRVGTGTTGEGAYTNNATILFSNYATGAEAAAAFAYYPGPNQTGAADVAGDVWVNISLDYNATPVFGEYGPHLLAHEIGHAVGISHPGDYNAAPGVEIVYPDNATYWQDSRAYTVMSYFGSAGVGHSLNGFAAAPQLHDIAAAQYLYGVNTNTRNTDTVYGFNSNTGRQHYTLTADGQSPVFAIWDGGGNDTLDLSGFSTPSEIDLRQEAFSSAGPGNGGVGVAIGNIAIARGAVVENAIGGSGADRIIGNSSNNQLTGNAGIDTAVYGVASSAASWARTISGAWTVTAGANGTDTLNTVEVLDFTDRDVVLDNAQQTFSGDGASDVLWRSTGGQVATWSMLGATQTGGAVVGSVGAEWTIVGSGDFSGDGRDDILWRRDDGLTYIWNNASSTAGVFVAASSTAWDISSIGDFNFDGRDDFLWRNDATGQVAVWTMNGAAVSTQNVIGAAGAEWSIQAAADFDGDGRDDILWRRDDGFLYIWETNGVAQTDAAGAGLVGTEWQISGTGDFNGDGRADILWQRDDGLMAIWHMDGATTLSSGVIGGVGTTWNVADVGDYNADGKDDILWRNDDGLVAVWTMNGFTVLNAGVTGSVGNDWDVIG